MLSAKKWFFMAAGLTAGFAAAIAVLPPGVVRGQARSEREATAGAGNHVAIRSVRPADRGLGFGPEMEAILPGTRSDAQNEMLNLETGGSRTVPGPHFNDNVAALVAWIRTSGVNISGRVWSDGSVDCITYNMTVVPVETGCWGKTAAEAISGIPVPEPNRHSPRRWLVPEAGKAKTYAFRTDTGTFGILRLVGLSDNGQGVKIRYKLVQAQETVSQPIAANESSIRLRMT